LNISGSIIFYALFIAALTLMPVNSNWKCCCSHSSTDPRPPPSLAWQEVQCMWRCMPSLKVEPTAVHLPCMTWWLAMLIYLYTLVSIPN